MKKRILFSLMFLFMLLAIPAQAQVRFGVKGGLDIAKLTFSDNLLKSDNKTGWFIGPTVEVKIPNVAIAIDAALLYTQTKNIAGAYQLKNTYWTCVYSRRTSVWL